jgi:hypothetical protein
MSILKKIAVGTLATVGVLVVKNRKAIASELESDLELAKRKASSIVRSSKSAKKSGAKSAKRAVRKTSTTKKRRATAKRSKSSK